MTSQWNPPNNLGCDRNSGNLHFSSETLYNRRNDVFEVKLWTSVFQPTKPRVRRQTLQTNQRHMQMCARPHRFPAVDRRLFDCSICLAAGDREQKRVKAASGARAPRSSRTSKREGHLSRHRKALRAISPLKRAIRPTSAVRE